MPKTKTGSADLTPLSPVTALPGISEARGALFEKSVLQHLPTSAVTIRAGMRCADR